MMMEENKTFVILPIVLTVIPSGLLTSLEKSVIARFIIFFCHLLHRFTDKSMFVHKETCYFLKVFRNNIDMK